MLTHLRARHRTIERGIKAVNTYLDRISEGAKLDGKGRCRVQYENVGLHVVALPDDNMLLIKAFINFLPDPETGKILPLYYHLLDMSDAPATGLAYFAIVASEEMGAERDIISVETKRPIADISFEEFEICLKSVGEVANLWMGRLEAEFGAPPIP